MTHEDLSGRGPLAGLRVLELSDIGTVAGGQFLADLGCDVVAIEPIGGSAARRRGPFIADIPDPHGSLFWHGLSRGKRSITLEPETADGFTLLDQLAATAHILLDASPVGSPRELCVQRVAAGNPHLIVCRITPFGLEGPRAQHRGGDLVEMASSSLLSIWGDPDRPPVRMTVPQSHLHTGLEAAVACLLALHERAASGRGQTADVSAQSALTFITQSHVLARDWGDVCTQRAGPGLQLNGLFIRYIHPAKDGWIAGGIGFGTAQGPRTRELMRRVCADGYCDEATRDKDWEAYLVLLKSGDEPLSELERVQDVLDRWFADHTVAELCRIAVEHGLLFTDVREAPELLRGGQLASRDFWELCDVEGRTVRVPGPFAKFGGTALPAPGRAPRIGEHNLDIYCDELGLSRNELILLRGVGAL